MIRALAAGLCVVASGCASHPPDLGKVQFPKRPETGTWLTLGGSGTLVIDRGCLRVRSDHGSLYTVYWESPFELVDRGGRIAILDSTDGRLFAVGSHVQLGGGSMAEWEAARIDPVAAKQCGPPFFSGWIPDEE